MIGVSLQKLSWGRDVEKLAVLAGVDGEILARFSPKVRWKPRGVAIAGEEFFFRDWTLRNRRWCPGCFRDDRATAEQLQKPGRSACWHRTFWDIRSVSACPVHQTLLAACCPRCGEEQYWTGPAVDWCRCGGDLAIAARDKGEPILDEAGRYIVGRLGLGERMTLPLIDALVLKEAMGVLERLGQVMMHGYKARRPLRQAGEPRLLRNFGAEIARAWPASFDSALDNVVRSSRQAGASVGWIATYGWIYGEWAARPLPDPFATELRARLREHAIRHQAIARDEPTFGATPAAALNIQDATKMLGMSTTRTKRLLVEEGLFPRGTRPGVPAVLDIEALSALKARMDAELTILQIAAKLGTGKAQAFAMASNGVFGQGSKRHGPLRFDESQIERFLDDLVGKAWIFKKVVYGLKRLSLACQVERVSLASAVSAVMDDRLRIYRKVGDAPNLAGLLVAPEDLRPLRYRKSGLSIEVAAEILAIHNDTARWLVHEGHIPSSGYAGVDPIAVAAFQKQFITATNLARKFHTSPRKIIELLDRQGVTVSFGPSCRQAIYDRQAALACARKLRRKLLADRSG